MARHPQWEARVQHFGMLSMGWRRFQQSQEDIDVHTTLSKTSWISKAPSTYQDSSPSTAWLSAIALLVLLLHFSLLLTLHRTQNIK